ncbi:MAG: hypothetical protein V7K64_27115 [Nostoc sp.]|uniref:hypothetical protein n=1 Tax=unclassified Nostoc TaxID=2593658 RepID=UPI002FF4AF64
MTPASNGQVSIIRTEHGLTILGTRITLYDVMNYVTEQYRPKFIRAMLNLTDEQVHCALLVNIIVDIEDYRGTRQIFIP